MSHLSILPTVLRDSDLLISSLQSMGLAPEQGGSIEGFGGEQQPVAVRVTLADGQTIAWTRQHDGRLALVADLQRISRSQALPGLLTKLTRLYALQTALLERQREPGLATAEVSLVI